MMNDGVQDIIRDITQDTTMPQKDHAITINYHVTLTFTDGHVEEHDVTQVRIHTKKLCLGRFGANSWVYPKDWQYRSLHKITDIDIVNLGAKNNG